MIDPTVLPGSPSPLGATLQPTGTNFAMVSAADGVLLCLFDPNARAINNNGYCQDNAISWFD